MTEIVLVRHGQASYGKANYDKLSQLGEQQAIWLGEYLAHNQIDFDALWRGDMFRHEETALGILKGISQYCASNQENGELLSAKMSDSHIEVYPGLNEFDFQSVADAFIALEPSAKPADDAPRSEFYRLLKKSMLAWSSGKLDDMGLPESWQNFQNRVMDTLNAAVASGKKRVVLSTSGGAIAMAVGQVLGTDAATMVNLNLQIRNTSITQIYANKHSMHLHQFNGIPHLETPERRESISYS
jgi:broad specificity phosphatase PhoE